MPSLVRQRLYIAWLSMRKTTSMFSILVWVSSTALYGSTIAVEIWWKRTVRKSKSVAFKLKVSYRSHENTARIPIYRAFSFSFPRLQISWWLFSEWLIPPTYCVCIYLSPKFKKYCSVFSISWLWMLITFFKSPFSTTYRQEEHEFY